MHEIDRGRKRDHMRVFFYLLCTYTMGFRLDGASVYLCACVFIGAAELRERGGTWVSG